MSNRMNRRALSPKLILTPLAAACALLGVSQANAAELSGTVVFQGTEQAAVGSEIIIKGTGLRAQTNTQGQFNFADLAAGTMELLIRHPDSATVVETISLSATDSKQLLIRLANPEMEHIQIKGQVGSLSRSLSEQRYADNLVTVVTADAIGEFPDSNASETLQRMPGLSIERDQGEGRYVRVRGLAPALNAVTYNGSRLTSPDEGNRAIGLDVIPSDLLQSLEVTKSLTPDMDADSLGGSINIKSLSAFDKKDRFAKFTVETSYDEQVSKLSPKLAATFSDRISLTGEREDFGYAFSGSWFNRKFGSENVETGADWDGNALEELEMRDYQIERERLGLAANFDWRPTDTDSVYLRTLYSRFSDEESRNALVVAFDEPAEAGDASQATETQRELKNRVETQTMSSVVFGSEHLIDDWTLTFQSGWSQSKTDRPDAIAGAVFEQEIDSGVAFYDSQKPVVFGPAALYDAASYELDEIEAESNASNDEEINARLDLAREFVLDTMFLQAKVGVKASRRDKESRASVWVFDDFDDMTLADVATSEVKYEMARFGAGIDPTAIRALVATQEPADFVDEQESLIGDFDITEDINAAYFMLTADWGELRGVAGVRYEETQFSAAGWEYSVLEDDDADIESVDIEARSAKQDYDNFLPSIQFRYELSENSVLRTAWTNSLVRPTFEQLSPGMLVEEKREDGEVEIESSFGNPDLKPLEASNFEFSAEYYTGGIGVLSLGLFYKDIKNFIYEADLAGSELFEGEYLEYDEALTYLNGDAAKLYGAEFNFARQLDSLPGAWSGLLFSTNVTWTDSESEISWFDDGERFSRDISFPSQSDITGNLALGYEDERVSLRLTATYKSKYLAEVNDLEDAAYDVYADAHTQFDFIAKANLSKQLMLTFKAINLSDEPYYAYTGRQSLNAQFEDYGRTFQLGLSYVGF